MGYDADELERQIREIRDGGTVNMFDASGVQRIADGLGFHDLVCFIEEHRDRYCRFILSGDRSNLER